MPRGKIARPLLNQFSDRRTPCTVTFRIRVAGRVWLRVGHKRARVRLRLESDRWRLVVDALVKDTSTQFGKFGKGTRAGFSKLRDAWSMPRPGSTPSRAIRPMTH